VRVVLIRAVSQIRLAGGWYARRVRVRPPRKHSDVRRRYRDVYFEHRGTTWSVIQVVLPASSCSEAHQRGNA
jgi:hypothetical protein